MGVAEPEPNPKPLATKDTKGHEGPETQRSGATTKNQNPPRRHGGTELHGENQVKSLTTESTEKTQRTRRKCKRLGRMKTDENLRETKKFEASTAEKSNPSVKVKGFTTERTREEPEDPEKSKRSRTNENRSNSFPGNQDSEDLRRAASAALRFRSDYGSCPQDGLDYGYSWSRLAGVRYNNATYLLEHPSGSCR